MMIPHTGTGKGSVAYAVVLAVLFAFLAFSKGKPRFVRLTAAVLLALAIFVAALTLIAKLR